MGVIADAKQFLANKAVDTAKKTADGIAALSALSPQQVTEVDNRRDDYLKKMPDMNGEDAKSAIEKDMGVIGIEVYQAYLEQLGIVYTPIDTVTGNFDPDNRIRYFDITKWVTDSEEQSLDKLVNVYHVLSDEDCNIALIYNRTREGCHVTIGIVNTNESQSDPAMADNFYARIISAIKGNFPGAEMEGITPKDENFGIGIPGSLENACQILDSEGKVKSVSIVSNIASEKSEDFISQSMEKLLDGIVPASKSDEYTIVLLAKPIRNQLESKNRLYRLYTDLSPYASWQTNYTYAQSDGITSSSNLAFHLGAGVGGGVHSTVNPSETNSKGTGTSHVLVAEAAEATGNKMGFNASVNFGVSFARSSNVTVQIGMNEGISQSYTNYGVKHTLEIIESQLKRFEESSALGMWEFAAYVVSDNPVIANNAAHMYLALTQGEESYLTKAAVNFWDGDINPKEAKVILNSIKNLQHPVFGLKTSVDGEWLMYPTLVTPTTPLSGMELAKALNFPRKSVRGLSVIETAAFGRNISSYDESNRDIKVGEIYHMHTPERQSEVALNKDSLTAHTFITGSTGTGKSNTIYQLLDKLQKQDCKYMVIEPAKGEYKDVFGGYTDVTVYGTNPMKTGKLLQINPFSFPEEIHVLEHIDRLVEILNACWPMYAAMPAVLKDAIEKSYEKYGWNLRTSMCVQRVFPNFADLLDELPNILKSSLFSDDTKGDYAGALVTRVKSMTNGINGLVLCPECETTDEELFENNVIVDISRVGSTETKSLYMGILVMRLQEHRMQQASQGKTSNQGLRHVTVLEEAHNLLRKTSVSQSQEGANLQGKSVEMITNAIAEMRTYGEGFIIADQAPGMLDEAVIRNTNTKIILRLPDGDDRELVGKAVALSDNQIQEIAKLPKGVAVVYQNDWVEAVLCQFEKFPKEKQKAYSFVADSLKKGGKDNVSKNFFELFFERKKLSDFEALECEAMKKWVNGLKVNSYTKRYLYDCLDGKQLEYDVQTDVMYNLFEGKSIAKKLENTFDEEAAIDAAEKMIHARFDLQDHELSRIICRYIVDSICKQLETGRLVDRFKDYNWRRIR